MALRRALLLMLALCLAVPGALARAQAGGVAAPCDRPDVPGGARDFCLTVAQAVESAQPQLGILIAGGNPTIGTASAGGLRLGLLPRVSASTQLNLVFVRLPDILAGAGGTTVQQLNQVVGIPAPALSGTVSVGIFPGITVAPTVGGIGSIDLLGSATWVPFSAANVEGFGEETADLAYGGGVKIGILQESFATPGISISVMHRRLGEVRYGDVCSALSAGQDQQADGYTFASGICSQSGDPGEFSVNLTDWSGRAMIGKRLLGLGLTGGVGYDRFESDVGFGFRAPQGSIAGQTNYYARAREMDLDAGRWSAFVDASLTALIATLAVEAGWLQGSEPITGFPSSGSDFDPGTGTFFGSLGVRIAL